MSDNQPIQMLKGALVIAGTPQFLFGGELHYFRLNPQEWRRRIHEMRLAHMNTVGAYIPWLWHEPTESEWDFTGATHPRRNLRQFLEICHDEGMKVFARPGPYVMAELLNEGIPDWIGQSYPEVLARTAAGHRHPNGVVSYLHPTYLRLAKRWITRVAEELRPFLYENGGPIVLWQLDNEVGMLHWVSNQADYHPDVLARYHAEHPLKQSNELSEYWDWQKFQQQERRVYLEVLRQTAQDIVGTTPYIVNVHGFRDFFSYGRGIDYPIGLAQLIEARNLENTALSGDFYPGKIGFDNYHDLVLATLYTNAANKPGRLSYSAEFQSGRLSDKPRLSSYDIALATRLVVAHGFNGVNYYMFSGGDNPEGIGSLGRRHDWQAPLAADGTLRPTYDTVAGLGSVFHSVQSVLASSEKVSDLSIAFYSPYYLTDTIGEKVQKNPVLNTFINDRTRLHFDGIYRILTALSVPMTAVSLLEDDLSEIRTGYLWVACTRYMDESTQTKLAQYVEQGGHLILGPDIPTFDLTGSPCQVLATRLGITDSQPCHQPELVTVMGIDSVLTPRATSFSPPASGRVLGTIESNGQTCAATWPVGSGQATLFGVGLTGDYLYQNEVVARMLSSIGLNPRLSVTPGLVHATMRTGDQGSLLSLINPDDQDYRVTIHSPFWPTQSEIAVPARHGLLLAANLVVTPNLLIHYATAEIQDLSQDDYGVTVTINSLSAGQIVLIAAKPMEVTLSGPGFVAQDQATGKVEVSWARAGTYTIFCKEIETFQLSDIVGSPASHESLE
ncbi:MAG: beta-galactosidase [Sulfobacillus benefaciens]|uniref:Beta-galactosidase n=1 Tax=Sulfobacillus benefaciens TaxID=453960 RepID=A0A2T2XH08_9FIRM|nr:MAG: beta-galactosidase [Sulfobacillus benefaciens]